jgi:4'-phosphopantetheinyl transferase
MTQHFVLTGMDLKPLELWCAYPDDLLADGIAEACAALLTEDERARVARFKFDRHQRESLTTRALVRTALSSHRPVPPGAWRFTLNAHGKPGVEPDCGLQFNLSNSVGLVVCLLAEGAEVGVDVESSERAEDILKLAPRVFSASEQAQLHDLDDAGKLDHALSLWTLKESYIKARGMGLALPLDKFSFLFGGAAGVQLEIDPSLEDAPARWRFGLLDRAGHRIAMMVEAVMVEAVTVDRKAFPQLEIYEPRPVLSPPNRVNASGAQWFPH